jgi:hypothetical protein
LHTYAYPHQEGRHSTVCACGPPRPLLLQLEECIILSFDRGAYKVRCGAGHALPELPNRHEAGMGAWGVHMLARHEVVCGKWAWERQR